MHFRLIVESVLTWENENIARDCGPALKCCAELQANTDN